MTRYLSLLAGGVLGLVAMWGCSSLPPPSDDDDDDSSSGAGNNGQGGATSSGGKAGSGSAGSAGAAACVLPNQLCNGVCTNTSADSQHCGNCATVCNGQVCSNGMCKATCDAGLELCAQTGACVAPGTCGLVGTGGVGGGVGGAAGSVGTGGQGAIGGMGAQAGSIGTGGAGAEAGTGSSGSAGTGSTGMNPPGYWTYQTMHGCAWTGIDTVAGTTTTVTPKDFTMGHAESDPYCVKGTVNADYKSVALLGFNLAQPAEGANCTYDPAAATALGPPDMAMTGMGLAISFSKTTASTLRVQIQSQDGATNEAHRWCTTITDAAGPVYIPYSAFTTECWEGGTPVKYNNEPISAVVFLVPGNTAASPYDFCINGFAMGTSVADAPAGGSSGPLTGTIGGGPSTDLDFQRVKVKKDGHSYIIQNNNWGNPSGSDQTLTYKDNSFKVTASNGSGSSAPASFPSIFIGANGDTQGGTYSTTSDDHLPKQISAITSVNTTFKYALPPGNSQVNAAFDIWFSANPPTACYGDAISGFIMLWFHKPSNFNPIGSAGPTVTIGGKSWTVWTGPRGGTGPSNGTCSVSNSGAPVVSYVANSEFTDWSGDLKPFFTDAASRGISSSWYLTDVFGGFEIWSGGTGAEVTEFTAVVAP